MCEKAMLKTNTEFLENEIMDVIRSFDCKDDFVHYFSFHNGIFDNLFEYNGEIFQFSEKQEVENDEEFKRYAKRFAKLAIYEILRKNGDLPWGALTGIRPTKLAYGEIERGKDFKPLFERMYVSKDNIDLVAQVVENQKGLRNYGANDLYISLPFCPTKCDYCSFVTAPIASTMQFIDKYIDCVVKEIESIIPSGRKFSSIYIGGGTPFVLEKEQLERVLAAVQPLLYEGIEFTVEAGRPDVFTREKLQLSKDYGVNRICVNPQSFNDETLKKIGRKHTSSDTVTAFKMAREFDFIINLDLIAGLEGESVDDFARSVDIACELAPENITVHTLSLKTGSHLKEEVEKLNVDGIAEMIAISREKLSKNGYKPYYLYRQKYQAGGLENVGWTKPNFACKYNVNVMEEVSDNIAVGANSVSKRVTSNGRIIRLGEPKNIPTYIEKLEKLIIQRKELFNL